MSQFYFRVMANIGRVALGLCVPLIGFWLYSLYATSADLQVYTKQIELRVIETPKLSPKALEAIATRFNQQTYFAAFAVNEDGLFGWVGGRHNIEQARFDALVRCNAQTPQAAQTCRIIAELTPKLSAAVQPVVAKPNAMTASGTIGANARVKTMIGQNDQIYFALATEGSWALQKPEDGWLLPQRHVLARCAAMVVNTDRPTYTVPPPCHLYRGKIIKAERLDVMSQP